MEPWKWQIGYALIWISILFFFIMMIVSSVKIANNTKRTNTEFQNEIHIPYYAFLTMFGAGSLIILTKNIEEGSSSLANFELLIALTASAGIGISLFIVSMSRLSMVYKA
jgi:uncharacterized membrane protein YadS